MGVGTYAKTLVLCDWPNNTAYWAAAAILLLNLLIKANFGGFRIWFWSRSSHFSFWRVKSCREVWNTFSKQVISAPLKTKAPPLFGLSLRLRRPAGSMAHALKWNWMGLTSSLTGCARVSERTIMLNVGLHSRRKKTKKKQVSVFNYCRVFASSYLLSGTEGGETSPSLTLIIRYRRCQLSCPDQVNRSGQQCLTHSTLKGSCSY